MVLINGVFTALAIALPNSFSNYKSSEIQHRKTSCDKKDTAKHEEPNGHLEDAIHHRNTRGGVGGV